MTKKILVLGGTRYFGKRLVDILIEQGHEVSVGTRGHTFSEFNGPVERFCFDRKDKQNMAEQLKGRSWDVVIDQICGGSLDAYNAIDIFDGCVGKYIFTSSIAVYDQNKKQKNKEIDFNPRNYPLHAIVNVRNSYAEGKRLAEAVYYQKAPFPVTSVRFPIVLGEDDYTRRLLNLICDIKSGIPLKVSLLPHEMSLISSGEAASFLAWLIVNEINEPINACSNGTITPYDLIKKIEYITRCSALLETTTDLFGFSLITHHDDWTISNEFALSKGFQFPNLSDWIVPLIRKLTFKC